jgi:hypothetical protein
MGIPRFRRWLMVAAMVVMPLVAHAQEATLSGTVTDETGGALPGVVVRAVNEATGNNFEAVSDARGAYRLAVRVGTYRVTAELAGFATLNRTVTLLVGQQAVADLQMSVSTLQESVTVTGAAPLLDVTGSTLSSNIDSRQLETLPVQGREWVALVMLAPGNRVNEVNSDQPSSLGSRGSRRGGDYQLNIDGQQISVLLTGTTESAHPRLSRDAIAEFEYLSNRFDATQGRSMGLQVNAITKSGTNSFSGSLGGYFRHDRFNASDHVIGEVLPYQNQQVSATFGGPILRDKLHFFSNFEYEREPDVAVYTTPYPHLNGSFDATSKEKKAGGRLDYHLSPRTRLAVRGSGSWSDNPAGGSSTTAPILAVGYTYATRNLLGTLTHVFSDRVVNETRLGHVYYQGDMLFTPVNNPNFRVREGWAPAITFRGVATGREQELDIQGSDIYSIRNDTSLTFNKAGRHTLKTGAEFLFTEISDVRCVRCEGSLDATGGAVPAPMEQIFPNILDATTWNLDLLSPISIRWRQSFATSNTSNIPRYSTGLWIQDDWSVTPSLTFNLGLRYDVELGAFGNHPPLVIPPFLREDNQPDDKNNFGPRTGFAYSLNNRTVLRGGYGIYFGTVQNNHFGKYYEKTINVSIENDRRPDFASNPWNGPDPTYEQLLARMCYTSNVPGCVRSELLTGGAAFAPNTKMPYAHQASAGVQRQFGATMAIEADYVFVGTRARLTDAPINVAYNPATGLNYPFNDIARRPMPEWGYVSVSPNNDQPHNYYGLQTAFTKRFRNRWQASATYTLSWSKDGDITPVSGPELTPVTFEVAKDLGGEYGPAIGDQRHRAVFNGIWEAGLGFQVSGLYFYGSGERRERTYNADLRLLGSLRPNFLRLRPDGSIIARNDFVGDSIHRLDMRIQRGFALPGHVRLDGIVEVFNVFNRANYGSYVTNEASSSFGRPSRNPNVAYAPRMLQLGLRAMF